MLSSKKGGFCCVVIFGLTLSQDIRLVIGYLFESIVNALIITTNNYQLYGCPIGITGIMRNGLNAAQNKQIEFQTICKGSFCLPPLQRISTGGRKF